ncbi:uncharacterized protein Dwil_GK19867 [Drosophila willistoni]|uniref:Uncharacterized protein n=1 Tax=Drosophila willistoni TaxID=7260 RepID=B4MSN3_DROWI|nr:uncharacterized protein Dwil_GK19867 [Drosophila willistoni]
MAKISSSSSSSISSPCGGFAQRRVAKLQAKNQAKLEQNLSQKDIDPNEQNPTISAAAAATGSSIVLTTSPAKCLLLAGLFLSLTSSSIWPLSGVFALPRHMHGRHLILPHQHHLVRDHDLSLKMAIQRYSLHQLDLEHPLREAIKTVKVNDNDNDDSVHFSFETSEIGAPVEELSKILDSLEIVRHLINSLKMPKELWRDTFTHISEKMTHNIFMATSAMGIEKCDRSGYTYNNNHANVMYAVGLEAIKLLTVVQGKYELMLESEGLLLDDV